MGSTRLLAATAAVVLGGCGAEEAATLRSAFEHPISSARVSLALDVGSDHGGMKMSVDGPYKSNGEGKLPSVDWALAMTGAGRTSQSRLVSSPEKAFIVHGGEHYEIAAKDAASFRNGSFDVRRLISDMRDWFPQADAREDAALDGEPITRVTGRLDLAAAAKDLKKLGTEGESLFAGFKDITSRDLRSLAKSVHHPRFTVDVARADGKLRRIVGSFTFSHEGQTGKVTLTIRLRDVDEPVRIVAPASGKPFEELGKKLVDESGVGDLYGDGGTDAKLRMVVLIAYGKPFTEAMQRWETEFGKAEAEERWDDAAAETRLLAEVVAGLGEGIAEEPARSAATKRKQAEVVAASTRFARALKAYADALEGPDNAIIEAAYTRMVAAAERYDSAVEAFR